MASVVVRAILAIAAAFLVIADSSLAVKKIVLEENPYEKKRKDRESEREDSAFKRNRTFQHSPPQSKLEPIQVLIDVLKDPCRDYMSSICHMTAWKFFVLADRLQPLIERARRRRNGTRPISGRKCHHDHYHRLFFCLQWLNTGEHYKVKEATTGWGKSSLHRDNVHVLEAIIEGLDDQIAWPSEQRREELANIYDGIFKNMIGIVDIKEHECVKYKDTDKEKKSYSGKHHMNSWKNLSIIDYTGRFIYVHVGLAKNDREMFTSLPLYWRRGQYFTGLQHLAADGGFDGDGPINCSFKDPGENVDRQTYNLAFREVRVGIENAFGRVCSWFPILGNDKKRMNYDDTHIVMAIHAASRLHNWLMNVDGLSYDAAQSADNYFKAFY